MSYLPTKKTQERLEDLEDVTDGDGADITWSSASMGGHIIPTVHASGYPNYPGFDIGSAEYKVRHLFLSDNSLWIGDEHKVSIEGGEMHINKRLTGKVPDGVAALGGTQTGALAHTGKTDLAELTLQDWEGYLHTLDPSQSIVEQFASDDFYAENIRPSGDFSHTQSTSDTSEPFQVFSYDSNVFSGGKMTVMATNTTKGISGVYEFIFMSIDGINDISQVAEVGGLPFDSPIISVDSITGMVTLGLKTDPLSQAGEVTVGHASVDLFSMPTT